MGKYASAQDTAAALVERRGAATTVTRQVPGTFDPITQAEIGATEAVTTFQAVCIPPTAQGRFVANSLQKQIALEGYFALKGQTTHPEPLDVVTWAGQPYVVFHTQVYDPAGDGAILAIVYMER